ncbi:hypothetical protein PC119_g6768 [Phytophthora cactorum]|nr:hypothetical protein PC119_g6768 [Phytophthora cactorum]
MRPALAFAVALLKDGPATRFTTWCLVTVRRPASYDAGLNLTSPLRGNNFRTTPVAVAIWFQSGAVHSLFELSRTDNVPYLVGVQWCSMWWRDSRFSLARW